MMENWQKSIQLLDSGNLEDGANLLEQGFAENRNHPGYLLAMGRYLMAVGNIPDATKILARARDLAPSDVSILFCWALCRKQSGTHRGVAEARDAFLSVIERTPPTVAVLREGAQCCMWLGPLGTAAELWRRVAEMSGLADDYYWLGETLAIVDDLPGAVLAVRKAVELAPGKYEKSLEDLEIAESGWRNKEAAPKKGRYPDTDIICGDLRRTIIDYVAADCKDVQPFITKNTKFFTMGSCFARNIVRALSSKGYSAAHMEISEYVNTTFANRYFVDWLEGTLEDQGIVARIEELLPANFSKQVVLDHFKTCDVFILTLGVAPSFFDRTSGQFVMPRPTALNSRALAEKYKSRTTTVAENVDNVTYVLSFVKKINKKARIIITESPVPLQMTFEFRSAVVADCLSKSTLRVAAHEVVTGGQIPDVLYWPSFEVFRWLGAHTGPVYGVDDGAAWHVSEHIVGEVIECFLQMLSIPEEPPIPS